MIRNYLSAFTDLLNETLITDEYGQGLENAIAYRTMIQRLSDVRFQYGTVYLIGNGGSSGIISHTGIDFLNKCHIKAYPITDNSLLTCLSNDYGYDQVFLKVLEKTAQPHDCLIAVSSSGKSPSIVNAAHWALKQGLYVVTFSGFSTDNPLRSSGHINFWLNSRNYGHVEIGHSLLLHILTDALWKQ